MAEETAKMVTEAVDAYVRETWIRPGLSLKMMILWMIT